MNSTDRLISLAAIVVSGLLVAGCSCSDDEPAPKPAKGASETAEVADPTVSLPMRVPGLPPPPEVRVTDEKNADGTVTLRGTARVSGRISKRKEISIDHVPGCREFGVTMTQDVIADDQGNLANVVVYIARGLDEKYFQPVPEEPAVLDQVGCIYEPHVMTIRTGQPLVIKNADEVRHNVNARPWRSGNEKFNELMVKKSPDLEVVFNDQEVGIPFGCDIHVWMKAYVTVVNHDFSAITGPDGTWEISGLPAEKLVMEVWHEEFGKQTLELDLEAGEVVEVDFMYLGKKPKGGIVVPVTSEE